jgi:hypothetical protein
MTKPRTPKKDPLQELLNEAATFGMLRRIYEADPKMNETTKAMLRTVFATFHNSEDDKRPL